MTIIKLIDLIANNPWNKAKSMCVINILNCDIVNLIVIEASINYFDMMFDACKSLLTYVKTIKVPNLMFISIGAVLLFPLTPSWQLIEAKYNKKN